jgi:hypothetical protein
MRTYSEYLHSIVDIQYTLYMFCTDSRAEISQANSMEGNSSVGWCMDQHFFAIRLRVDLVSDHHLRTDFPYNHSSYEYFYGKFVRQLLTIEGGETMRRSLERFTNFECWSFVFQRCRLFCFLRRSRLLNFIIFHTCTQRIPIILCFLWRYTCIRRDCNSMKIINHCPITGRIRYWLPIRATFCSVSIVLRVDRLSHHQETDVDDKRSQAVHCYRWDDLISM